MGGRHGGARFGGYSIFAGDDDRGPDCPCLLGSNPLLKRITNQAQPLANL